MILCVPVGWVTYSEPLVRNVEYAKRAGFDFKAQISNRVDLNRSHCIEYAKIKKDDLIMVDGDVTILTEPERLKEILKEDEKVADVVVGIIVSGLGVLVRPLPPKDKDVFEVDWASLGFVYLPYRTIRYLKPISIYGENTPLYMSYTPKMSEDVEFVTRLKKKGKRIVADKRIKLAHWKNVPVIYTDVSVKIEGS